MVGKKRRTTQKEVLTFLRDNPLGTLITMSGTGVPEPSAIYFYTGKDFTIHFVTKTLTRKFRNAERRPGVTLYIYNEEALTSVSIRGQFTIVNDTVEFAQIIEEFQTIAARGKPHRFVPPVAQIDAGHYVACTVRPSSILYRRYAPSLDALPELDELTFDPRI